MIKSFFIMTIFWSLLSCNQSEKRIKETAKTVNFEKLYFHTTSCDGACPVYHVEVTKDKGVRLLRKKYIKLMAQLFLMIQVKWDILWDQLQIAHSIS